MSGHTPISPHEGSESGDNVKEEEDKSVTMKDFDSRRSVVLIKLHCVQARYIVYFSGWLSSWIGNGQLVHVSM